MFKKLFFKARMAMGMLLALIVALVGSVTFGVMSSSAHSLLDGEIAVTDATAILTALGVLGVIVIAATIGLAALLWRKFRH